MTERPLFLMRRCLQDAIEIPVWPDRAHLSAFSEERAAEIHALLELAYAKGGGALAPYQEWWPSVSTDSEYSPNLCFPVCDNAGAIIAVAQCWTSAFVKDFAVHPGWRRRGIGRALLLHVFRVFQQRGAIRVGLKVQQDNPSGAVRFYESLGMIRISDEGNNGPS